MHVKNKAVLICILKKIKFNSCHFTKSVKNTCKQKPCAPVNPYLIVFIKKYLSKKLKMPNNKTSKNFLQKKYKLILYSIKSNVYY